MTFFLRVKTFYHETNNSKTNKFACIGTFVYIVYICKKTLGYILLLLPTKKLGLFCTIVPEIQYTNPA